MSRSGYSEDCDNLMLWRGAVRSAIKGRRGQAFLRELLEALDALPQKRLVADEMLSPTGEVCALGSVGVRRGMDAELLEGLTEDAPDDVAKHFGIAYALAAEIVYVNDEARLPYYGPWRPESPEARWQRVRAWVVEHLARNCARCGGPEAAHFPGEHCMCAMPDATPCGCTGFVPKEAPHVG